MNAEGANQRRLSLEVMTDCVRGRPHKCVIIGIQRYDKKGSFQLEFFNWETSARASWYPGLFNSTVCDIHLCVCLRHWVGGGKAQDSAVQTKRRPERMEWECVSLKIPFIFILHQVLLQWAPAPRCCCPFFDWGSQWRVCVEAGWTRTSGSRSLIDFTINWKRWKRFVELLLTIVTLDTMIYALHSVVEGCVMWVVLFLIGSTYKGRPRARMANVFNYDDLESFRRHC